MANRKNCVKCGRGIDGFARLCPYCNWWQSQPVPAARVAVARPVEHVASLDPRTRNGLLGILTFGFLLMVAFTIGAFVHGPQPATAATPQAASAPEQSSSPRATVTLIPITEGAPPLTSIETPVTSVPSQGTTSSIGPSDLTALPAEQYAAASKSAPPPQATGSVIDPRSITGSPYAQPSPQRTTRPRAVATVETQPIPIYQPVPHVRINREATAQLALIVGTDGRVHDIDIQRDVPGVMGPLIGTVQQWRFRPATQNGQPVSSRFTVAVTFRP